MGAHHLKKSRWTLKFLALMISKLYKIYSTTMKMELNQRINPRLNHSYRVLLDKWVPRKIKSISIEVRLNCMLIKQSKHLPV